MITPYDIASARVYTDSRLTLYADILLQYDWPENDEMFVWVSDAPILEIIEWCAEIRSYEHESMDFTLWQ